MANNMYIDFGVTPYALADVCEALFKNGVTNAFLTKEDGDIHVRWEYKIDRGCRSVADKCDSSIPVDVEKPSFNHIE